MTKKKPDPDPWDLKKRMDLAMYDCALAWWARANATYRQRLVECPALPYSSAISQNWITYYNPFYWEQMGLVNMTADLYHEPWHILLKHFQRLKHFPDPPELLNMAADFEIDSDRKLAGRYAARLVGPDGQPRIHLTPEMVGFPLGLLAEEYVELLRKLPKRPKGGWHGGSGSHGIRAPWEDPDEQPASELENECLRKDLAKRLRDRGNIPGHLQRFVDEALAESKVPWQSVFASLIQNVVSRRRGEGERSYMVASRRQGIVRVGSMILPGKVKPEVRAAEVIDVSGSVDKGQLGILLSETQGILDALGVPVNVFVTDTEVHGGCQVVRSAGEIELEGGDGTDMGTGIRAALEVKPDLVVVLTDGFTPWPSERPPVPVVVGLLPGGDEGVPEWASLVRIE